MMCPHLRTCVGPSPGFGCPRRARLLVQAYRVIKRTFRLHHSRVLRALAVFQELVQRHWSERRLRRPRLAGREQALHAHDVDSPHLLPITLA